MHKAVFIQFSDGNIEISDQQPFTHCNHIELAYFLLSRHDFFDATSLFVRAIKQFLTKFVVEEKFHATITLAFLAIVAERMAFGTCKRSEDFATFIAVNSDLLDKNLSQKWYPDGQLNSMIAKNTFVLPKVR